MSDTTGWKRQWPGCYTKIIDGVVYELRQAHRWASRDYWIVKADGIRIHGAYIGQTIHNILDAKRAAHEHARGSHE